MPLPTADALALYSADAILGLNDTDPVSTWPDSSGNGRNLTQAGAPRPVFRTNQLGTKPAVSFASASLDNMASGSFTGAGQFHALYLLKYVALPAPLVSLLFHGDDVGFLNFNSFQFQNSRLYGEVLHAGVRYQLNTPNGLTTGFYTTAEMKHTGLQADVRFWRGGQDVGTVTQVVGGNPGAAAETGPLHVCAFGAGPFPDVDIAEIAYYNAGKSALERLAIYQTWAAKYGAAFLDCFSEVFPVGATTGAGAGVGGPASPLVINRPTQPAASVAGDFAVLTINMQRNAGQVFAFTNPGGWVFQGEQYNDGTYAAVWTKLLAAGEANSYSWAFSPVPLQGGGFRLDVYRGLNPSSPLSWAPRFFPKGSGFPGTFVGSSDWTVTTPTLQTGGLLLVKGGSDGRLSSPAWTVPNEWLTPDGIQTAPAGGDANDWHRRRGAGSIPTGTTWPMTPSLGAVGIVVTVGLNANAFAPLLARGSGKLPRRGKT